MKTPVVRGRRAIMDATPIGGVMTIMKMDDEKFAAFLGVSERAVQSWRLGDKEPPVDRIRDIVAKCHGAGYTFTVGQIAGTEPLP